MAAGGNPLNVTLGPGRLSYASLGTAEPTLASAALPSAWQAIGYTENGTEFDIAQTTSDIPVAEEFDPVATIMTSRSVQLVVEIDEATKRRLLLARGAGASFADDGASFDLPDPSAMVNVMIVWDSDLNAVTATNRRWLFRSCTPTGTIKRVNNKAPAKRTFAVTFSAVKPDSTHATLTVFPNLLGQV